jgi:hypothetical protein
MVLTLSEIHTIDTGVCPRITSAVSITLTYWTLSEMPPAARANGLIECHHSISIFRIWSFIATLVALS